MGEQPSPDRKAAAMSLVISQLAIDCADPYALAQWWARVLEWDLAYDPTPEDDEVSIVPADRSDEWIFLKVPEVKTLKNRLHVDFRPANDTDQDTELARLLDLGATRVDVGQGDVAWHVLADPEGNEFCLLKRTPAQVAADEA